MAQDSDYYGGFVGPVPSEVAPSPPPVELPGSAPRLIPIPDPTVPRMPIPRIPLGNPYAAAIMGAFWLGFYADDLYEFFRDLIPWGTTGPAQPSSWWTRKVLSSCPKPISHETANVMSSAYDGGCNYFILSDPVAQFGQYTCGRFYTSWGVHTPGSRHYLVESWSRSILAPSDDCFPSQMGGGGVLLLPRLPTPNPARLPRRLRSRARRPNLPKPRIWPDFAPDALPDVAPHTRPHPGDVVHPKINPEARPLPWRYPALDPWTDIPVFRPWVSPEHVPYEVVPFLPNYEPNGDPVRGPDPEAEPQVGSRPLPGTPGYEPAIESPPDTVPTTEIIADPRFNGPPLIRRNVHQREKSPSNERDRKAEWKKILRSPPMRFLGAATEACDFVEALYGALPFKIRKKYERKLARFGSYENWRAYQDKQADRSAYGVERSNYDKYDQEREWGLGCDQKAKIAYDNLDEVVFDDFMETLILQQIQDAFIGALSGGIGKRTSTAAPGRIFGLTAGPAI